MTQTIGIIGAGFAGLSSAKVLQSFGFDVTVFEKEPDVGGVWAASRRYPGLTTQNPRREYSLSDFPMPDDYPEWPNGEQVQAYLEDYARYFGLMSKIHLETRVEKASLDEAAGLWTLQARGPDGALRTHRFDWLIVANGVYSEPAIPPFPGSEAFTAAGGRICHTSEFTRAEDARGRDVLVIGYGKSSCDVANAIAPISRSTTVLARHLLWKLPKKFFGVLNFKHLMLTRMGEALFRYIDVKGFEKFLHGPGKPIRQGMMATVQAVVTRQLHLEALGLKPDKSLETITEGTVGLVSDGFYEKVRARQLAVEAGCTIASLQPGKAQLTNGKTLPADIIVCGTGWKQRLPFFDADLNARLTDARGNFRLYRQILPSHVPRLCFVGYNSSFFSQLSCEVGALWVADYLLGGLQPPPLAAREAWIDRRLAWLEARTGGNHSRGTNIVPFSMHNIDELLVEMGLQLNGLTRLRQWFGPVNPHDYAVVTQRLLKRHLRAGAAAARPPCTVVQKMLVEGTASKEAS